jgi:NAD+ kinase
MPSPSVLLVYKRSAYLRVRLGGGSMGWLRQEGCKPFVRDLKAGHWSHYGTLATVKAALKERGLEVVEALREDLPHKGAADGRYGLVVVVGGDGTFLDASHYTSRVPILGVNSDPRCSVARFSACDAKAFPGLLDAWATGRVKPARVPRLSLLLNDKPLKWPVLNDVLAAAKSPATTSRYLLRAGGRREEQMSSGVWIATAAGSTAAMQSAGGRELDPSKPLFQYVVREPYERKFGRRRLLGGVLKKGTPFEMVSLMREGMLFLDGSPEGVTFTLGDRLKVALTAPPLPVIGLHSIRAGRIHG